MAELATIARPYADALFKASMADLDGAAVWVEELQGVASDVRIQQLADNPNVRADQVFDLITGVVQSTLPDMAKNFLRTVIANGRLSVLPEIAVQFRALKNAATGSADAVVYSAFAIDEAELKAVSTTLEKRFGRPLNITVKLDPELIGGIRVVVGDEVLDSSVKARLEQMKAALTA